MIQLNLLPDVKMKYASARRKKRLVIIGSVIASGVALVVVGMLVAVVYGTQSLTMKNLDRSIADSTKQLQSIQGLSKILTIQNQLKQLTDLHDKKPVMTRVLPFLSQVTPSDVQVSDFSIDMSQNAMTITGDAKSVEAINKFADTLKFTAYTVEGSTTSEKAFSEVVLVNFDQDSSGASYSISFKFNPEIYASKNKTVALVVPKITSTRSETERPSALFSVQQTTPTQSENR